MGTRRFCDNCGNTIRKVNIFTFGQESTDQDVADYKDALQNMQAIQKVQLAYAQNAARNSSAGSLGSYSPGSPGVGSSQGAASQLQNYPRFTVELCDHCGPGWLTRVQNLTKESDPKEG